MFRPALLLLACLAATSVGCGTSPKPPAGTAIDLLNVSQAYSQWSIVHAKSPATLQQLIEGFGKSASEADNKSHAETITRLKTGKYRVVYGQPRGTEDETKSQLIACESDTASAGGFAVFGDGRIVWLSAEHFQLVHLPADPFPTNPPAEVVDKPQPKAPVAAAPPPPAKRLTPVPVKSPALPPLVHGRRPVVVVACASQTKLLADITYLTTACQLPQGKINFEILQRAWTQGTDPDRPLGCYMLPDNASWHLVAFAPIKNVEEFKAGLRNRYDQVLEINPTRWRADKYVLRLVDDWVFISESGQDLDEVPDPLTLLNGLHERYTLSVRLDPTELPAEKKRELFDQWQKALSETNPINRDTVQAMHRETAAYALQYLTHLVDGTHLVEIGLAADAKAGKAKLGMRLVPAVGSSLADQLATPLPPGLPLAGFDQPEALLSLRRAAVVTEADRKFAAFVNQNSQEDAEARMRLNALEESVGQKMRADTVIANELNTLAIGDEFIQQAVLVRYDSEPTGKGLQVVVGIAGSDRRPTTAPLQAYLADYRGLQTYVHATQEFDIQQVQDVMLHRMVVDSPRSISQPPDLMSALFGHQQRYMLGTGPGRLYVAVGANSDHELRAVLSAGNGKSAPPDEALSLRLSGHKLMELLAQKYQVRLPGTAEMDVNRQRTAAALTVTARRAPGQWNMEAEFEAGMLRLMGGLLERIKPPSATSPFDLRRFDLPRGFLR